MINPNICKRVKATVKDGRAYVNGVELRISDTRAVKDGSRYLYLKYSILSDSYYLTVNG